MEVLQIDFAELAAITAANTKRLFQKLNKFFLKYFYPISVLL